MRPRLLPTVALCSLACCLLLCGLWAVSWWRTPSASYVRPAGPWSAHAQCIDGVATGVWQGSTSGVSSAGFDVGMARRDVGDEIESLGDRLRVAATGFSVRHGMIGRGLATVVAVPLWLPIVLTTVLPAMWWRRRRRQRSRGFPVEVSDDA